MLDLLFRQRHSFFSINRRKWSRSWTFRITHLQQGIVYFIMFFTHHSNPTVIYLNICSNSVYIHRACNVVEAQATHPVPPKRKMTLIRCLDVWCFFDFPVFLAFPGQSSFHRIRCFFTHEHHIHSLLSLFVILENQFL